MHIGLIAIYCAALGAIVSLCCAPSFGEPAVPASRPSVVPVDLASSHPNWKFDHGGVVRGDPSTKQLALIFTGGDFGEGTGQILDALKSRRIKASFFFTGAYLRKPEHQPFLKRIVEEDRDSYQLVSKRQRETELQSMIKQSFVKRLDGPSPAAVVSRNVGMQGGGAALLG